MIQYCLTQLRSSKICNDERGVTIVEYAIMLALIAIAVAAANPGIKDAVTGIFTKATSTLNGL